jgi:AcrR family transcriptional regulator
MLTAMLASQVTGRARPMPPEDRRTALIAAALPLVCQYGKKVTTRQIAEAAGVAEGTIFRVFRDKDELIQAAIAQAFDAAPTLAELDRVDASLPMRVRVMGVTSVLQRRLQLVFDLMIALKVSAPPNEVEECRQTALSAQDSIFDRIERLVEPDRELLRCSVPEFVRLLRLVTFAGSHPMITNGQPLSAGEVTDLLLDGVRRRPDHDDAHDQGNFTC